ncbi:MAG: hypothetical protein ACR2G6_17715 [Gemmatimonadaceae bacterium]
MKSLLRLSALAIIAVLGCPGEGQRAGDIDVLAAQQEGLATVSVRGIDLEQLSVEVSSSEAGVIVIPVGTVFASSSVGTQTMMAAKTIRVVFPGEPGQRYEVPQVQTVEVDVYCLNRMLKAPTPESEFTVVAGGGEQQPVRVLATCLETQDAEHSARQLAIWMTSDGFLGMSEDEVRQQLRAGLEAELEASLSSPEKLAMLRDSMPGLSDEDLQQILNNPVLRDTVLAEARSGVETEIARYKTEARALLEACQVDLSAARFFQEG